MNKTFKVIYNHALGFLQVVSELAKSQGKCKTQVRSVTPLPALAMTAITLGAISMAPNGAWAACTPASGSSGTFNAVSAISGDTCSYNGITITNGTGTVEGSGISVTGGGVVQLNNISASTTPLTRRPFKISGIGSQLYIKNSTIKANNLIADSFAFTTSSGSELAPAYLSFENSSIESGNPAIIDQTPVQRHAFAVLRGGKTDIINSMVTTYSNNAHAIAINTSYIETGINGEVNTESSIIKTFGSASLGLVTQATSVNSGILNSSNSTIETSGRGSAGTYALDYGVINFTGGNITTKGINSAGAFAERNAKINLSNTRITTSNDNSHGAQVKSTASITSEGDTTINVSGSDANGVEVLAGGVFIGNKGSTNKTLTVNGTGSNNIGFNLAGVASLYGITSITASNHGVVLNGTNAAFNVAPNATKSTIMTTGSAAHGILLQNGAVKTFDGTANNVLPTVTVNGANSALLAASGTNSRVTLQNQTLDVASTIDANSFGLKAESAGLINAVDSRSGGTAVWATNGTVKASNATDFSGSRVLLENAGILDLSGMTQALQIGSLESTDALSQVAAGNKNLDIGSGAGSLRDMADFRGKFTNVANLVKSGSKTQVLSSAANTVGAVDVRDGALRFTQNGSFATTGDFTTRSGATLAMGADSKTNSQRTLSVGGVFTQQAGANLDIAVNGNQNDVSAASAVLGGNLTFRGFGASPDVTKASGVIDPSYRYQLITTQNGITGGFDKELGPDYLLTNHFISSNNKNYMLGFGLAWIDGGSVAGTGHFTLAQGTAFDVDVALADRNDITFDNWTGHDLFKDGAGELTLSAQNTYTGQTDINDGTLLLSRAGDISHSNRVNLNSSGAVLDISQLSATSTNINNLSGVAQSSVVLGDKTLGVNNNQTTEFAGSASGDGGLSLNAGHLILSGDNTFTGLTRVAAPSSLQIGKGQDTGSILGDLENNGTTTFDRSDSLEYAGRVSGTGELVKEGAGDVLLSRTGSSTGKVTVNSGALMFNQGDAFNVTGDYLTANGRTDVGRNISKLNIGGAFTQTQDADLTLTLDPNNQASINAGAADLDGTLTLRGFSKTTVPVKASDVGQAGKLYTLISTTTGINGDFTNKDANNNLVDYGLDYLFARAEAVGKNYEIGLRLTWNNLNGADSNLQNRNGVFTLADKTAFDVDIALDDQAGTITTGWNGKDLTKDGAGELTLSAQNGYTGKTHINDGTLYLSGAGNIAHSEEVALTSSKAVFDISQISSADTTIQNLSGVSGSHIIMGAKNLNVSNSIDTQFSGDIDASPGELLKDGAGDLSLSGKTLFTGNTLVNQGRLLLDGANGGAQLVSNVIGQSGATLALQRGASLTGWIDPLDVAIDNASTWNMTANSSVDNINLAGKLNIDHSSSTFNTLTVNGNWVGNNGTLSLNTALGADDSSTDLVKIAGDSSGTTMVTVNNAGGTGAQTINGIRVIEVKGRSDGEFVQNGRIAAGAYDYFLGRGRNDANNWYLTSSPSDPAPEPAPEIVRPEAGGYISNLFEANNMFVTRLHDRLGETQYVDALSGEQKVTSMWLRNVVGENRARDAGGQLKNRSSRHVLQLGGDIAQWTDGGLSRGHVGVMAGYGRGQSTTHSGYTGYKADGVVEGYSAGLYGTWFESERDKSGLYADSWVQYSWFDNTVSGQGLAAENYKSKGLTASVETGYTFKAGENAQKHEAYFIQPKAQVTWMGVKADAHHESNGTHVEGDGEGNIQTRLGARAFVNINKARDNDSHQVFQPFVEANWVHNTKPFGVQMDGVTVSRDGTDNIAELKIGVEGQLDKELQIWGNVSQQVGSAHYSDTVAMLGVKYSFQ
ncbi:autotransporter outer membrane beta-barrel domain-containing protein [Aeromonas veronii]|uniref:autotransporter outer membrane beta-barrel domain-containing protein n=1 Tax=Aeromonas veronii TaxID=654 RepID=UPI001302AA45|nr:autotransporter outer membrane beta-barrel domain-containing protein [Aeromonas veronii]KAE9636641.1 autotransporter outer membrane beta-barrel domain-containing protein [Aeromonas veronii]